MAETHKVTLNQAPTASHEAVKKAMAEVTVSDTAGRHIRLRKPGVLAQYRIVEVLGDSAKNEAYMGMVFPLLFVTKIDDDDVYQPVKKSEVEALIQRLDEHGIAAVMQGVMEHFGAPKADEQRDAVKK